jgi:hypothetical protein
MVLADRGSYPRSAVDQRPRGRLQQQPGYQAQQGTTSSKSSSNRLSLTDAGNEEAVVEGALQQPLTLNRHPKCAFAK